MQDSILNSRKYCLLAVLGSVFAFTSFSVAQDVTAFERHVTVKKLPNGLTAVICERPEAPVFSFFTHVDVGSSQEEVGQSGLAHMFEHMAFKGTDKIGTKSYLAEKLALAKVEKTYAAYNLERRKRVARDEAKLKTLEKSWQDATAEANKHVIVNEFGQIVENNGGEGMNAFTNSDETGYNYSFPSNRVELWAYLESERFLHPVLREFYKERNVVMEERRMRTDSSPVGRLVEQFGSAAFVAHPYHRPVVGWMSDLQSFSATDAQRFYDKYYVPANITVTVAGDVKAREVLPVLEKYFGRLPAKPKPEELSTIEPPQMAERRVILHDPAQPFFIEGYHRPDYRDKDDAVYDAIGDLMSNGRTSRLYRALVRDKKIAAQTAGFGNYPGQKYPNLFVFYAVPLPGHTNKEMEAAVHVEIERIKNEDVSSDELKMLKTRAKAGLLRSLGENEGLAQALGTTQARYGDWRELFRQVDRIDKLTAADIRRVANKTFLPTNRTVGVIETEGSSKNAASQGAE